MHRGRHIGAAFFVSSRPTSILPSLFLPLHRFITVNARLNEVVQPDRYTYIYTDKYELTWWRMLRKKHMQSSCCCLLQSAKMILTCLIALAVLLL